MTKCGLCGKDGQYAGFIEDNSPLGQYWDLCQKCFDKIMEMRKK
jgi:hypothetical protein